MYSKRAILWADSLFATFTKKQKIGQLFMVAAYSNKDTMHIKYLDTLVTSHHIGGLIFFQGGPKRQIAITNRLQNLSKTKLLIGIDAEWGLNMRLDSTMYFPRQMTLAAGADEKEVYEMGAEIAKHCKRMGIHINFAPVADVNNNPLNPVIGMRSFSESKYTVTKLAKAYMKGLQHQGIMACAKHFPGHGDTDSDSHHSLPVIKQNMKRLHDLELFTFKKLMQDSLQSVMVAHIHVPALDSRPNVATTLSQNAVDKLLKSELKFSGLVFTDALNMKGVAKYYAPGEVDLMALKAGNDVLLFSENVPLAIQKIDSALATGLLDSAKIYASVKKILAAKYDKGLAGFQNIDTARIYDDLNNAYAKALRQRLYEKSVVVMNNNTKLPIQDLENQKFASICTNGGRNNTFQSTLELYAPVTHYYINTKNNFNSQAWSDSLRLYSKIFVSVHGLNNMRKKNFGITDSLLQTLKWLDKNYSCVFTVFGNPYAAENFSFAGTLVYSFEDNEVTKAVVPQLIFGALPAVGKLPVSVSSRYKMGYGYSTNAMGRLRYAYPETIGLKSLYFNTLDSIAAEAVKYGAMPGAQLQISKQGVVIYKKCFGYQSYDNSVKVTDNTIYDIASVTKTAGTLQAFMMLYDWDKININQKLSYYLPELANTNKKNILIKDMLAHQAGLTASLELWKKLPQQYLSSKYTNTHTLQATEKVWLNPVAIDSLYAWVYKSKLLDMPADTGCYSYKYSDLAFLLLHKLVDKYTRQSIADFMAEHFYNPLGTKYLCYNPAKLYNIAQIAPAEEDHTHRMQLIRGYVHDPQAAMMGGIAGHAGLFATANDLNILGQMNLQNGEYARKRYFRKGTIPYFAAKHFINNRRGLGWDRPFPPDDISLASDSAFGHTGFTGTAWWIDPEHDMVFTFLSNRTYPFADNKRLTTYSIRTKLLNAVYKAIKYEY
ncbi:MAG: glycoside hydrolase family 3 N-terminal domain-containing protein [Cytophagales bacterium]|nr:glycoside hydrolase family 3 N-terminal domain-containing protein [Cytophagales bacterium]